MASTYSSSDSETDHNNMETESSDTLDSGHGHGHPSITAAMVEDLGLCSPYDDAPDQDPVPEKNLNTKDQQVKDKPTIFTLLKAYGSLSVPQLLGLLAPGFTHSVLPESLDMPTRDKEAFAQHAAGIFSIFESFRMDPREVLKMEGCKETWVVRAHMEGVLKGGKGQWKNECVMFVKMDDEGTLVEEIREFVDSAKAVEMKRQHAPESFGAEEGQRTAAAVMVDARPAAFLTTFCWFLVCVVVAKLGGHVMALVVFWAHPKLEVLRRSASPAPVRHGV